MKLEYNSCIFRLRVGRSHGTHASPALTGRRRLNEAVRFSLIIFFFFYPPRL